MQHDEARPHVKRAFAPRSTVEASREQIARGEETQGHVDDEEVRPSGIRPQSEHIVRQLDLQHDDPGELVRLKEAVYGQPVDRDAFAWQYFGHPRARDIHVFVVESRGHVVAATTRLPATLLIDGAPHPAFFNVDSMVHPEHRRKGHMRTLYEHARESLPGSPIFVSKGSSSAIYPMLRKIGYQTIEPNTFLVSHPSLPRWALSVLGLHRAKGTIDRRPPAGFEDFHLVERFGPEHDLWLARVCAKLPAAFARDAAMMSWRYVDIPHRRYSVFARVVGGEIQGLVVLAASGEKGVIVDILWAPERADEPRRLVRFAQACLAQAGASRVVCFATHLHLRAVLRSCGFGDREDTPRFSALVPPEREAAFRGARELHVVDGDGDTEFS